MEQATATSLYRYYDEHDVLLYVGITSRGAQRNSEHNKTKPWWAYVVRQEVEHFPSRDEALTREAALIGSARPPFNTQHNPTYKADQATYLAVRAKLSTDDPVELWRASGKSLPLQLLADGSFLMRAEDIPITSRMVSLGVVRVIHGQDVVGRIHGLERRGPFVYLDATVRRNAPSSQALADLKLNLTKTGPEFKLHRVRVA